MSELHNTDPTPEFAGFTYFRSCAGNIQVLPQRPDDDASQLPTDEALNELLADVKRGISDPSEVDGDQATAASRLRERRSAYVPLDEATINSEFAGIVAGFGGTPGLVLMPGGKNTLIWMPATKYADGRVARLMSGPPVDDVEAFAGRLSLIAPPTVGRDTSGGAVYATDFAFDTTHPTMITDGQRADWLERSRASGLEIGLDLQPSDPDLDNFILDPDGKLRYIDRAVTRFAIARTTSELDKNIGTQHAALQPFISQSPAERAAAYSSAPTVQRVEGNWWEK